MSDFGQKEVIPFAVPAEFPLRRPPAEAASNNSQCLGADTKFYFLDPIEVEWPAPMYLGSPEQSHSEGLSTHG